MLNVKELFTFAILLEENGITFYRHALKLTDDMDAKVIFEFLGDEEVKHKQTFETLYAQAQNLPEGETLGDYTTLLRTTIQNVILRPETFQAELAKIKDVRAALTFAQARESESIAYYGELKKFLPASLHPALNRIIQEEGHHYEKLTHLLQKK